MDLLGPLHAASDAEMCSVPVMFHPVFTTCSRAFLVHLVQLPYQAFIQFVKMFSLFVCQTAVVTRLQLLRFCHPKKSQLQKPEVGDYLHGFFH